MSVIPSKIIYRSLPDPDLIFCIVSILVCVVHITIFYLIQVLMPIDTCICTLLLTLRDLEQFLGKFPNKLVCSDGHTAGNYAFFHKS